MVAWWDVPGKLKIKSSVQAAFIDDGTIEEILHGVRKGGDRGIDEIEVPIRHVAAGAAAWIRIGLTAFKIPGLCLQKVNILFSRFAPRRYAGFFPDGLLQRLLLTRRQAYQKIIRFI